MVYLPGHCPTGPAEDLGADGQHDLPVAGVDVGGLVAGEHGAAVDVCLAVQHREARPVLNIQNHADLPSTPFCRDCFYWPFGRGHQNSEQRLKIRE